MNKVLVKVFFPATDEKYDVWIPLNKTIFSVISLITKGSSELNNGIYHNQNFPIMYNKFTGEYYNYNSIVQDTNIKNGTELILI